METRSNSKPICTIHQRPMKLGKFGYFCATPIEKSPTGEVLNWCDFKVKDILEEKSKANSNTTQEWRQSLEATKEPLEQNKTDWDAIARGKVRSLFVQALIQHRGLEAITQADVDQLEGWVDYAMKGSKVEDVEIDEAYL